MLINGNHDIIGGLDGPLYSDDIHVWRSGGVGGSGRGGGGGELMSTTLLIGQDTVFGGPYQKMTVLLTTSLCLCIAISSWLSFDLDVPWHNPYLHWLQENSGQILMTLLSQFRLYLPCTPNKSVCRYSSHRLLCYSNALSHCPGITNPSNPQPY